MCWGWTEAGITWEEEVAPLGRGCELESFLKNASAQYGSIVFERVAGEENS